jgi:hypothetical protein
LTGYKFSYTAVKNILDNNNVKVVV